MKIAHLWMGTSYSQYGNGDFIFNTLPAIPECSTGYWIRTSDKGFEESAALVRDAFKTNADVIVSGEPKLLWSGTSGKRCHLYTIALVRP